MPHHFGASDEELIDQYWFKSGMKTHGSAFLMNSSFPNGQNLGSFKNNSSVTHGNEHAEDVFIRTLKNDHIHLLMPTPEVNQVVLCLSKSPCSSEFGTSNKAIGCAEALIEFHTNTFTSPETHHTYSFELIVIAYGVYKSSEGSRKALDKMKMHGIRVETDVHLKKDGTSAKRAY